MLSPNLQLPLGILGLPSPLVFHPCGVTQAGRVTASWAFFSPLE